MDFELTAEQTMLRDSVRRFGDEHYPATERLRMLAQSGGHASPRWPKMAGLGWLGLLVSEDHGGAGATSIDVMTVMEGFGRRLMLEPFASSCVLAPVVLAAPTSQLQVAVLRGIAAGEATVAAAVAEPGAGFALDRIATTAESTATGFRLTGTKSHVEDGGGADWFIVPARTAAGAVGREGVSLFLVNKDAANLIVTRHRSIDHHRHAQLRLDGVAVEGSAQVGPLGEGLALLESAVDRAIAAHLAEAVGAMDALRDICLEYLKTRRQFGVAIGSFQVLQHRMVDVDIACEEARSMVYYATLSLDASPAARKRAVAAAKVRVGQCSLFVGRQAVQLHGGLGMSAELIVSHYLKRLMMIDVAYGNVDYHRQIFAKTKQAA